MKESNCKIILPLLVVMVLVAGCSTVDNIDVEEFDAILEYDSDETDDFEYVNIDKDEDDEVEIEAYEESLLVNENKCIGCGHCVKTASEYFEMQSGKAVVVSQNDLDDESLEKAIGRCPVGAINIA